MGGLWESRYALPEYVALDWNVEPPELAKRKEEAKRKEPHGAKRKKPHGAERKEPPGGAEREEWIASVPINPDMLPDPSWQQRHVQKGRGEREDGP